MSPSPLMSSADAGVNSMTINGGIVWTIVVFIGGLALYTQVDASQRVPVFNKSDNILAACQRD